jgi:hypothetical protein
VVSFEYMTDLTNIGRTKNTQISILEMRGSSDGLLVVLACRY